MIFFLKPYACLFNEYIDIWLEIYIICLFIWFIYWDNELIFVKVLFICDGVVGGYCLKAKWKRSSYKNQLNLYQRVH